MKAPSGSAAWWVGAAFVAVGFVIIGTAFDVIHAEPESFKAPRWVVGLAGLVMLVAGLMVWANAYADPWVNECLAFLLIGAFATIASWIAFGPGPREFSTSIGIGPGGSVGAGGPGQGNGAMGRAVFVASSVVLWALELWVVRRLFRLWKRRGAEPRRPQA